MPHGFFSVLKMSFSGALKLADVSDFIAPSQACIVNFDGKVLDIQDADGLQVPPPPSFTNKITYTL